MNISDTVDLILNIIYAVLIIWKVTGEVAKQIESGAKSVDDATTVLDQVVNQLRRVAGK